ncbi:hypothetical protein AGMMS49975_27910 [Clostridia bacterium]|nr:hypothetical protein AGMMS49975_27910 [Clostridia bacterium]
MNISREHLHNMVDVIDVQELDFLHHLLLKLIPQDYATIDEIDAIKRGRAEIAKGETVNHSDIDWDAD